MSQKVVIPKGAIQAGEAAIIEIPACLRSLETVTVAKDGVSSLSQSTSCTCSSANKHTCMCLQQDESTVTDAQSSTCPDTCNKGTGKKQVAKKHRNPKTKGVKKSSSRDNKPCSACSPCSKGAASPTRASQPKSNADSPCAQMKEKGKEKEKEKKRPCKICFADDKTDSKTLFDSINERKPKPSKRSSSTGSIKQGCCCQQKKQSAVRRSASSGSTCSCASEDDKPKAEPCSPCAPCGREKETPKKVCIPTCKNIVLEPKPPCPPSPPCPPCQPDPPCLCDTSSGGRGDDDMSQQLVQIMDEFQCSRRQLLSDIINLHTAADFTNM